MADWFEDWFNSKYYHILYKNRSEQEAIDFVHHLVDFLKLPHSSNVLDIACGKGRHSRALANEGMWVTGVDIAPNSIIEAQKNAVKKISYYVHDMRTMLGVNCFDVAFNFFTSFGYFKTAKEHQRAARNFSMAVKSKGYLVIDFLNATLGRINIDNKPIEIIVEDGITFNITRKYEQNRFTKTIQVIDKDIVEQHEESLSVFTQQEFEELFATYGMKLIRTFGDYLLNDFDENTSPKMILIFQKIK